MLAFCIKIVSLRITQAHGRRIGHNLTFTWQIDSYMPLGIQANGCIDVLRQIIYNVAICESYCFSQRIPQDAPLEPDLPTRSFWRIVLGAKRTRGSFVSTRWMGGRGQQGVSHVLLARITTRDILMTLWLFLLSGWHGDRRDATGWGDWMPRRDAKAWMLRLGCCCHLQLPHLSGCQLTHLADQPKYSIKEQAQDERQKYSDSEVKAETKIMRRTSLAHSKDVQYLQLLLFLKPSTSSHTIQKTTKSDYSNMKMWFDCTITRQYLTW